MFSRFRRSAWVACTVSLVVSGVSATQVSVDVAQDRVAVSPYLYGKNGCLSDNPQSPLSAADWQKLRDAGVRMVREHGGNNGTKYNWQKKLTSHPDWYNNVYAHDWDYAQASLQQNLPGVQCMWCFQLIGKVADNAQHNFDDWGFNQSQGWSGTGQNLAGGGVPNTSGGGKAAKEGDPSLYLTNSDATTSTAILDHFTNDLHLDRSQFQYWNMDNEPEIWNGTHDDVMPTQLSAEDFMQRYFAYAKAARARYPDIKLAGPVTANEWQWYNWATPISADGRTYPWLEYFIKRVGEEEARTGVRLLDVLDLHYYPGSTKPADIVQLHRTFFDTTYVHPEANGVHAINGGWDTSITQEYIFGRCAQWLTQYLGENHGVTFGLSETGIAITNAPVASVWYASTLGEFMKHGVEIFTPWSWQPGMWEVLHLYSRYNYGTSVRATSDDETNVSAYATVDAATGSVTVVLVNRALTASNTTTVSLTNAAMPEGTYDTLQLANLPATETFVSHTQNALATSTVNVTGNQFSLTLPPLSITSVLLKKAEALPPPSPSSRLANVSVRAKSGTGANVLIVGFVVDGDGSKKILLRGIGPTLGVFGVGGTLPDPVLTLGKLNGPTVVSNDNWSVNAAEISGLPTAGGFPLKSGSLDAALVADLTPGAYTAKIEDKGGGEGVAMGEAYDPDPSATPNFINISARTWVGTDADSLFAGFVVTGGNSTVLIRAVGPTLEKAPFNLTGMLSDPVLRVYRQGDLAPSYQNDDWATAAGVSEAASGRTFPLASGAKDAAVLVSLPECSYSAVVSGKNGATGIALVEVYQVK